jgi:hypothetical protein
MFMPQAARILYGCQAISRGGEAATSFKTRAIRLILPAQPDKRELVNTHDLNL